MEAGKSGVSGQLPGRGSHWEPVKKARNRRDPPPLPYRRLGLASLFIPQMFLGTGIDPGASCAYRGIPYVPQAAVAFEGCGDHVTHLKDIGSLHLRSAQCSASPGVPTTYCSSPLLGAACASPDDSSLVFPDFPVKPWATPASAQEHRHGERALSTAISYSGVKWTLLARTLPGSRHPAPAQALSPAKSAVRHRFPAAIQTSVPGSAAHRSPAQGPGVPLSRCLPAVSGASPQHEGFAGPAADRGHAASLLFFFSFKNILFHSHYPWNSYSPCFGKW